MSLLRLLFVSLCLTLTLAVQESERHFDSFSPEVTQSHLHRIPDYLDLTPSIASDDALLIALNLAEQALDFHANYIVKNSYVSYQEATDTTHVYLKQIADDGREIFNADLNINVHDKKAVNVGHSFFKGPTTAQSGHLTSMDAINILTAFLKIDIEGSDLSIIGRTTGVENKHEVAGVKGANNPAKVRAGHVQVGNGKRLEPVWDIELDMDIHWWNAHVSSVSGEVLSVFDWVSDVNAFNIYPIGVNDPSDGGRAIVQNPAVSPASPVGWNDRGFGNNATTIGNNAYAQSNPTGGSAWLYNPRPIGTPQLDFIFPVNFSQQPQTYTNASVTNLFAWNNFIHDIFYGYGFNETAGNFQESNFGRGGLGNDAVQANAQDGAGYNNANMATPVDGQRPRMRMYLWSASNPYRDGDFDQGIIIHEYAHGISTRMTGGPMNSNCLGSGEAGGMGEGWGDFFSLVLRQRSYYTATDIFPMGAYSANKSMGIRMYPYTTDMKIDPETYAYINLSNYTGVHAKGEVWCGILWEVYWNFVSYYGFDENIYSSGEGGNNRILQLVVDGLRLQPCNPNFVSSRDAIFLADKIRYDGVNFCRLWTGFAKRGLGVNAVGTKSGVTKVIQDFSVPVECENYGPTTSGSVSDQF